jgi:HlyD family secretion protein
VEFTKGKTIKELKSEIDKARSDELVKDAAWKLEQTKEIDLERQLGKNGN